jgi:hypothetical protein
VRARPRVALARRRFGSSRIDDCADLGDPVRGKTALPGVLANQVLVRRDINAVDLVIHHVTFDPLNPWSEIAYYGAGLLRGSLELFPRQFSDARNFSFDDILWHNES